LSLVRVAVELPSMLRAYEGDPYNIIVDLWPSFNLLNIIGGQLCQFKITDCSDVLVIWLRCLP